METIATPNYAPVPEEAYEELEEFLGAKRDTPEFQFRLDGIRKMLDEAAKGPFIPMEEITGKALGEYAMAHPEEIEAHREELRRYGFA
jgi:hypothetical protein